MSWTSIAQTWLQVQAKLSKISAWCAFFRNIGRLIQLLQNHWVQLEFLSSPCFSRGRTKLSNCVSNWTRAFDNTRCALDSSRMFWIPMKNKPNVHPGFCTKPCLTRYQHLCFWSILECAFVCFTCVLVSAYQILNHNLWRVYALS